MQRGRFGLTLAVTHPALPTKASHSHGAQPRVGLLGQLGEHGWQAPAGGGGGMVGQRGLLAGGNGAGEVQQAQQHHAMPNLGDEGQGAPDLRVRWAVGGEQASRGLVP